MNSSVRCVKDEQAGGRAVAAPCNERAFSEGSPASRRSRQRFTKRTTAALRIALFGSCIFACFASPVRATAATESFYPGATEVYRCRFEVTDGDEFNGWPPHWVRYHAPGYPRYLKFRISDQGPPSGGRSLRVVLDGGSAAAHSPRIPLKEGVNYVLSGYIRTDDLRHDHAYLSVTFLDRDGEKLESTRSQATQDNGKWQQVTLGPVSPPPNTASVVIGLFVESDKIGEDLHGSVSFGDLRLGVLPRFTLVAQVGDRTMLPIFHRQDPIEVHCAVSGFGDAAEAIEFRLEDRKGRLLAEQRNPLHADDTKRAKRKTIDDLASGGHADETNGHPASVKAVAESTWALPIDDLGFYRVRAAIVHHKAPMAAAEISMVVIDTSWSTDVDGFGWSLPRGSEPLGWHKLPDLLRESGIGSVRFPFPCGPNPDEKLIESNLDFCERLNRANISVNGILVPPTAQGQKEPLTGRPSSAARDRMAIEAFDKEPETWYPGIEPLLARLATQIRWWQLGVDRDPGWLGCQELPRLVGRPKEQLDRIAQNVSMGVAWNWTTPFPYPKASLQDKADANTAATAPTTKRPVGFLTLPADATVSNEKMAERLDQTKDCGIARWVVIEPLPPEGNSLDRRAGDLVNRMIVAKMHGAEGIFLSDPFDPQLGVVQADGAPRELFLPWRTTAHILGGTKYLGDIDLPDGHILHCFGRKGYCVAVAQSDLPGTGKIYLGDDVHQVDIFGRTVARPVAMPGNERAIDASDRPVSDVAFDELPTFLTGLSDPIARWHLGMTLDSESLPGIPNTPQKATLTITNPFPQAIVGQLTLMGPKNWRIEPPLAEFKLPAGQTVQQPIEITLPNDLTGGRRTIRIDVEVQADRTYRFTTSRQLDISLGDVVIDATTRLNERGDLEIMQTLTNKGKKPVGFRCQLFVPDRRRQAVDLFAMPEARDQTMYRLPNGKELLGKTIWLRAEEINGNRVMNYPLAAPRRPGTNSSSL